MAALLVQATGFFGLVAAVARCRVSIKQLRKLSV
jgi:hypothetical protein